MDEEFLRLQYDQLRKVVDENINQRRRMQEYVLAFVVAIYVWIILNRQELASLSPDALIWLRWLPTLVVLGAAARWFGHQIVIRVVAEHMRAIETYFYTNHGKLSLAHAVPPKASESTTTLNDTEEEKIDRAMMGYENAVHSVYTKNRVGKFLNRFPASASEFAIWLLVLLITVFASFALGEAYNQHQVKQIFLLEFAGWRVQLEHK